MNTFEKIIKDYVEQFAQGDAVFASKYEKSGKDIEGCCRYIKSEARKQAQNGCAAIELSTKTWSIIQCRGRFNKESAYHKKIMDLMNNNIDKFRRTANDH